MRVWRPGALDRLKVEGVKGDLFSVLKDFFATTSSGRWVVGKRVNRGCPQGSILGPQMWKLVVDALFRGRNEEFGVVARLKC